MATAPLIKPTIARYSDTAHATRDEFPEAAGQTWKSQSFVTLNASGQFEECSTTPANFITGKVWGLATNPATGTTNNATNVEPISTDKEILISFYNIANPTLAITAQTLVGDQYAIDRVTVSGVEYWIVDQNNVADPCCQITRIAPEWPMGTTNGPVYVKVLKSILQYNP